MTEAAVARDAIRQTMVAYNIAGDRFKLQELAETFTEDGVLETPYARAAGHGEIVALLGGRREEPQGEAPAPQGGRPLFVRHNLTTSQILVDGEEATGRTYFIVITDRGLDHMGHYVDRFRKVGNQWLIAHRQVRIDYQAENSAFRPMARAR